MVTAGVATAPASQPLLDQALWQRFRAAADGAAFASAWLALQCRFTEGALAGVLVLGEPDTGPFHPAACWPDLSAVSPALSAAAEAAMQQRQGVTLPVGGQCCVAAPILLEGRLHGVCAIALPSQAMVAAVMRQLQWGSGWVEALLRREQMAAENGQLDRATSTFDLLGVVLEHAEARASATALATELARRFSADPVCIGFRQGGHCRVAALSNAAYFGDRMTLVRDVGSAMDEALDQQAVILFPPRPEWEYHVTRAHAELAATHRAGAILTLPLRHEGAAFGAIQLERPAGESFTAEEVELLDAVASVVGPVLAEKRANDRLLPVKVAESLTLQARRLLGAGYFGRKLTTLGVVLVVVLASLLRGEYAITSPAVLEGRIQRSMVAPFAGYIAAEHVRAGEVVAEGQLLARLDDQDLRLERVRLVTQRQQRVTEYDRALAARQRAEASIARSQIDQAEAQLAMVEEQLARTRLVALIAGMVVRGNLSQRVGGAVERGEELFQIAPLDVYRVILEVDEGDIRDIAVGQRGLLVLASLPDAPQPYVVDRITPIAEQKEGRNFFRVEGELAVPGDRIRPSMVGVGRTSVGEALLAKIWTRRLLDWLRLAAWRWAP